MKKRILSVLLALMLVVSLVPNHVHAADECTHDYDYTTGICNLCSYECPHDGEIVWQWSLDEHWPRCWDCLYHVGENEPHTIVDGECSVCNYAPCTTHSAAYWEDYAGGHRKICPDCYDMVLVEWEAHIDENGDSACDVCSNPTCAEHTLVKAGITHSCQNCSYYLFCLDDNNDCICDIGGEVYHDLSKATWERSETQHRHICGNCGEVASEWVDHSLDENDVCYDCGYGCAHENMNDYCYCYDCRQDLHTDADGDKVCDKCHWCVLGHDSNFGSYCEFDIYVQFCGATCTICGNFVAEGHYDPEETGTCEWCGYTPCTGDHVFVDGICTACGGKCWYIDDDGDGACDSCGCVCSHKNTEWSYDVDGYHVLTCYDCYTSIDSGYHTLKDGKCTVCGAKPCADEIHTPGKDHICTACGAGSYCVDKNRDCVCDICEAEMHEWEFGRTETHHGDLCSYCGEFGWKAEHADSDGVGGCDECGYGCKHSETEWNGGTSLHIQVCLECGWELSDYEYHTYVNGKCSVCGIEACKHEEVEWSHDDLDQHYSFCTECRTIVDYPEPHTLANGKCTVCGAKPCADGKHTCEEHGLQCDTCGAALTCVDTDGDCVCDVCKDEYHPDDDYDCDCDNGCGYAVHDYNFIMGHNEKQHWELCYNCGDTRKTENHIFVNGICYECGYGCDHKNVYNRNWFSHFMHFWECKDCGYIGANFGAHEDENGDHLCDLCAYDMMHSLEKIPQVDATCTESGVKEHYFCRLCGRAYADAEGKIPVVDVDLTIPAAHSYKDGVCTVCNAKDPLYVKVEVAEDVPEVKTELPVDDLLTEEDKAALAAGTAVKVELTVENVSQTVIEEHKVAIEELLTVIAKEKQEAVETGVNEVASVETVVVMYLDINLTKTVGDAQADAITETNSKIRITIDVPAEYRNAATGVAREFSVIRVHGDEVTELKDLDNDPNTVTFETDRFSTYALAYSDTKVEEENPKTGDSFEVLLAGLVAVSMLCAAAFVTGKRN